MPRSRARRAAAEPRLEMTPMMDLTFLLLTFFIFAFALQMRLNVTDIRLPTASSATAINPSPALTIALSETAQLTLDRVPLPVDELTKQVKQRLEASPDTKLFIAADQRAPTGALFELIDALKAEGITDLRFLRLPPDQAAEPATTAPR